MVRLQLSVQPAEGDRFELTVVQSVPRRSIRSLAPGTVVQARLGPGRIVGAVIVPE
jgi:multidrug efflux pump subunit AcrA (membrane-fusion protein)